MFRLFACLLPIILLCGFRPVPPAATFPVALSVVDRDDGRELQRYPYRGQHWIEGTPGHRYAVRLRNSSDRRVLVVLSVDGVNAITGATAAPEQTGYVLDPWQTAEITGWRKSDAEVAQFVFTDHGDSYASRTARPANVGVIGIAVFDEARPVVLQAPPPHALPRRAAAPAAAAESADMDASTRGASANRQQLGTGHGQREWSASSSTTFERASRQPMQTSQLRYDARARLVALGILPRRTAADSPQAFPGTFVPDPPARVR